MNSQDHRYAYPCVPAGKRGQICVCPLLFAVLWGSAFLAHMKQVADEIWKLHDMEKTVFIVTHDLEFILSCCDHIVRLEKGQVVENFELNKDTDIRLRQFFTNES